MNTTEVLFYLPPICLDSRDKVRALKDTLNNCKNLLHCKRDDLRKHWIESMELNDVLFLLDKM